VPRVRVGERQLDLSNLDKVLYPSGFTKGEVIGYYQAIAPVLLPHLSQRPLTLKRYPNGVDAGYFYEKRCPGHRPDWFQTAIVHSSDGDVPYCVVDDLPSLVWVANLASLELHTPLACAADMATPTMMVFDLDPGPPAGVVEASGVALRLRQLLREAGLEAVVKTSGSKGLQLYVPLNSPVTYAQTKGFSRALAQLLEKHFPDEVVSNMKKDLRPGKVLIDWSQNDQKKTTVCVYSLRARERPTVSTPLTWEEVSAVASSGDPSLVDFDAPAVVARVQRLGDLFEPAVTLRQELRWAEAR
jgi:bifunctional non-homologous end joining protein LigD